MQASLKNGFPHLWPHFCRSGEERKARERIGCLSVARRAGMYDDCTRHQLRVAKSPVHIGPLQQFVWNESRAMQRAYAVQQEWGGMTGFGKQIVRNLPQRIRLVTPSRI